MSRAWMPLYVGDWLRDTMHLDTLQQGAFFLLTMHCWQHERLPTTEAERAAVARLRLSEWRKIRAPIEALFQDDGTSKRITHEIQKMETIKIKRQIAGAKGGFHSSIARNKGQPKLKQMVQQIPTNRIDNHNHKESSLPDDGLSALEAVIRKKGWVAS